MISAIYPIPAFTDNYIWASSEADSLQVCVVDLGDKQPVIEYLESSDRQLSGILITHHHTDGIQPLTKGYFWRVAGPSSSRIKQIREFKPEGDSTPLFGQSLFIIETPCHTLYHIAYCAEDENQIDSIIFCGDTFLATDCSWLFAGLTEIAHEPLGEAPILLAKTRACYIHEYTMANFQFAADAENDALIERIELEKTKRAIKQPTLFSNIELELAKNLPSLQ
ncbi:MAG: hydroxyacylglutathione hydrolase C-terminal domain-containing protein [Gammaproteobacteria bacterium]